MSNPISTWPVPGHHGLTPRDPETGENDGHYGAPRTGGAHSGIDIQAPDGACVVAAGAGTVLDAKPNPCRIYGNQVVIDHGDGIFSQSAHLATTVVNPGDKVVAGQLIGTIGRTGDVPPRMDTHLHFEVRLGSPNSPYEGGQVRDPLSFFYPAGG